MSPCLNVYTRLSKKLKVLAIICAMPLDTYSTSSRCTLKSEVP